MYIFIIHIDLARSDLILYVLLDFNHSIIWDLYSIGKSVTGV